ncbi:MAG: TetR/AcrR family transcriptional regulator [Catalinimonas sp.]
MSDPSVTDETRERIKAEAERCFLRYGIRAVSMDDLARELSISKRTIYQHFKDKDELILETFLAHRDRDVACLTRFRSQATDAVEEMILISTHLRRMFQEMNPMVLYDLKKYHPRVWDTFDEHRETCLLMSLEANLRRGVSEGVYRDDVDPEILSRLRIEQVQMAFDGRLFPTDRFAFAEVQMQFLTHFIHGLVTPRGRELVVAYQQKHNP